ncbi:MAG: flavin monoamine oxidase family protein [Woeseiaceae bacterium]
MNQGTVVFEYLNLQATLMQTDVVIVGAGVAGLSAAKHLACQGVSFIVVEASHRIGGRAYSEEIGPDTWFDLGCAYLVAGANAQVREDESNPLIDFAFKSGAVIEEYRHPTRYVYNGRLLGSEQEEALEQYFADCDAAIQRVSESGADPAISEVIDVDSPFLTPYSDMMAVTVPKDLDESSTADFHFGPDEYVNFNTQRGYGNLVAQWGSDIDVSLNSKVESVNWAGQDVQVKTSKGTIRARCVISTVSTGVLAAQQIEFEPRLPDAKIQAIQEITMGAENKIGVHFTEQVFTAEDSGYYQVWSDEAPGAYVDVNLVSTNIVTVFIGGRFSIWMEQQGQDAAREFAIERIVDIFGNDVRKSVGRTIATAWATDPWTFGSYASANPGQYRQREELPEPIDGKLFFAGEATAWANGTANGAYWSGIRAACEVMSVLAADKT